MKLLLDERANDEQMKFLLDEGMRECQGAALWVYNNAVFSDTDFSDIIKLGGATKEQEINKIGSRSSTNRCFASNLYCRRRAVQCVKSLRSFARCFKTLSPIIRYCC